MNPHDEEIIQKLLDILRAMRSRLYQLSDYELSAMSLRDQSIYSSNLTNIGNSINSLEHIQDQRIIEELKLNESSLRAANDSLQASLMQMSTAVQVVRTINQFFAILLPVLFLV